MHPGHPGDKRACIPCLGGGTGSKPPFLLQAQVAASGSLLPSGLIPSPPGGEHPPAVLLELLGLVGTVEELALEELHGHHSEDEHEEHVDDEDVKDILE